MTDTVPTSDEVNGDFSMSGVTIYDPKHDGDEPELQPKPSGQRAESAVHAAAIS